MVMIVFIAVIEAHRWCDWPVPLTSLLDDPLSDLDCRLAAFGMTVIVEGEGGGRRG